MSSLPVESGMFGKCCSVTAANCKKNFQTQLEFAASSVAAAMSYENADLTGRGYRSRTSTLTGSTLKELPTGCSRLPDEAARRIAEENGVKLCPRCDEVYQKADSESCDHMVCGTCGLHFCWTCLADRNVILQHGNHYHHPTCKFYAAYDGRDAVQYLVKCTTCSRSGKPCQPPKKHSRPYVMPLNSDEHMAVWKKRQSRNEEQQKGSRQLIRESHKWTVGRKNEQKGDQCSICCFDFMPGEEALRLKCNHTFHSRCVDDFLSYGGADCPMCKVTKPRPAA